MTDKTEEKVDKTPPVIPEPERVLWFRLEHFKKLLPDLEDEIVEELARAVDEVDRHDIEKLLNAGCSQKLAAKILKPLNPRN